VFYLIGFAVSGSCRKICDNCITVQLTFPKHVIDMLADGLNITPEQLSELLSIQPDRIRFQPYFDFSLAIGSLVDFNLIVVTGHIASLRCCKKIAYRLSHFLRRFGLSAFLP
jgi:hypothetical protein